MKNFKIKLLDSSFKTRIIEAESLKIEDGLIKFYVESLIIASFPASSCFVIDSDHDKTHVKIPMATRPEKLHS